MNDNRINNDFDEFLKKRYENHTIEPEKALWDGINTQLYQKRIDKNIRKVRHLRIALSTLAAILVGTIIYFEIKTQKYQPETQIISEMPQTTIGGKTDIILSSLKQNNSIPKKNSDSINNIYRPVSEEPNSVSIESKTKAIRLAVNSLKETNRFPSFQKQASDSVISINYSNSISKENIVDNEMNSHIIITSPFLVKNTDSLKSQSFALMTIGIRDSATMVTNNASPIEKIMIPKYIDYGSSKFFESITSYLPMIARSGMGKSINPQIAGSAEISQLFQKSDPGDLKLSGTSKTEGNRLPFFIEGFVSPEISYRALIANTKFSIPDYGKTYFNKKEKPDFTFSTGFSVGFGITDNIILRSGVFYSRYSLRFKTEAFNLISASTDGNFVYTSSGTVKLQLISSDSLSNESLLKSSLNFSYLNIPLVAELHFLNNYFINLGLNFNMLVGQNMNWQAENYDGNFSNANADPIEGLEKRSLSMIIGFGTEKPLTRKLSMILNPSLKICLSSINNTGPVKSYPYTWGFNAGLRYYFN